jgi:hypothetical protein
MGWADGPHSPFFEELELLTLFNQCGIDGLWVKKGLPLLIQKRGAVLRDSAQFFILGANLVGIGPGYFTRQLSNLRLGITGLYRPEERFSRYEGLEVADPEYTLRRVLTLIRSRADLIGVMGDSVEGVDLKIQGEEGKLAQIIISPGLRPRIRLIPLTSDLPQDSLVMNYQSKLDSILAQSLSIKNFLEELNQAILAEPSVTGVVMRPDYLPKPLVGTITVGELLSRLPLDSGWPVIEASPKELVGLNLRYRHPISSDAAVRVAVDWQTLIEKFSDKPFTLTEPLILLLKDQLGDGG